MVAEQYRAPSQTGHDSRQRPDRWLAGELAALAIGLAINSLLGPLIAAVIEYPLSETLLNQTIGLEAVSLLIVAPWSALAAVLVLRGHRAGSMIALPPAAYTTYMFLQYIVGPQYTEYPLVIPLQLAIFVLSGAILVRAWNRITVEALPALPSRRERVFGMVLFLLAGFTISRYISAFQGILTGATIPEDYGNDPTMYWSIFLLDLGVVVPVTIAAG